MVFHKCVYFCYGKGMLFIYVVNQTYFMQKKHIGRGWVPVQPYRNRWLTIPLPEPRLQTTDFLGQASNNDVCNSIIDNLTSRSDKSFHENMSTSGSILNFWNREIFWLWSVYLSGFEFDISGDGDDSSTAACGGQGKTRGGLTQNNITIIHWPNFLM